MSDWKEIEFDSFIKLKRGYDLPDSAIISGSYPVAASTLIKAYHNSFKAKPPGVVTGRSGSLGTVQYIKTEYWPLNTTLYVKDFKDNLPKYVYYFLQTLHLENFNSGAGVPTLNQNHLHKLKVRIPPLPSQRKIAAILSAYDDLIENCDRRITLLEKMAEEIYREWFVRLRFPGHEQTTFHKGIPEGWEIVKLEDVSQLKYGKMPKKEEERNTGYPIFSGYGITGFHVKQMFKDPVIVVVARGVGGTGDVKFSPPSCWLTNLSIAVICQCIDKYYLYYFLRNQNLRTLDTGSAQSQITTGVLSKLGVILPPENLQIRFSQLVTVLLKKAQLLRKAKENLSTTRDRLLTRLISGKLSVEDLDIQFPPSMIEDLPHEQ